MGPDICTRLHEASRALSKRLPLPRLVHVKSSPSYAARRVPRYRQTTNRATVRVTEAVPPE